MTSFFSFALRLRSKAPAPTSNNNNKAGTSLSPACLDDNGQPSPTSVSHANSTAPPAVAASHSGDTLLGVIGRSLSEDDASDDKLYIRLRRRHVPTTPEGLRPRRSIDSIRKELGQFSEQGGDKRDIAATNIDVNDVPQSRFCSPTAKGVAPWCLLPPYPSASWSTQGVQSSPYNATPTQEYLYYCDYGHSTLDEEDHVMNSPRVALSPTLLPGQARTAVGAVVALQQQQEQVPLQPLPLNSRNRAREANVPTTSSSKISDWDDNVQRVSKVTADNDVFPREARRKVVVNYDNTNEAYHSLDHDPIQNSRTPPRNKVARHWIPLPDSPSTTGSAPYGSPSSLVHHEPKDQDDPLNTSFSSQAGLLIDQTVMHPAVRRYDFGPLVVPNSDRVSGTEVVLASNDPLADLSAMSGSAKTQDSSKLDDKYSVPLVNDNDCKTPPGTPLPPAKSSYQKRQQEALVVAALERLQDNIQLVLDVDLAFGNRFLAVGDDHDVETQIDKEGLLAGIVQEKRESISANITAILNEMNTVQPEEFFMSPSQVPEYTESHDELQEALSFCRSLVEIAVPASESDESERKGRWDFIPGLRANLGLIPPESPEAERGGDTSVFSLPSDSARTPMTSNVSLTTTITSALSPLRSTARMNHHHPNGLELRRTIEIFSTLLRRVSGACLQLEHMDVSSSSWSLGASTLLYATEQLKRNYLQMLAMDTQALKALVDAFRFDFPQPLQITREVSCDDDEVERRPPLGHFLPPPPPMLLPLSGALIDGSTPAVPNTNAGNQSMNFFQLVAPSEQSGPGLGSCIARESRNSLSPTTEDMRTLNVVDNGSSEIENEDDDEYDDLRRQVGSNDYDDELEVREGPEEERQSEDEDQQLPLEHLNFKK